MSKPYRLPSDWSRAELAGHSSEDQPAPAPAPGAASATSDTGAPAPDAPEVLPSAHARAEAVVRQLEAELSAARQRLAEFEARHGCDFDQFVGTLSPEADPYLHEEALTWSHWAERCRALQDRLQHAQRAAQRLKAMPAQELSEPTVRSPRLAIPDLSDVLRRERA